MQQLLVVFAFSFFAIRQLSNQPKAWGIIRGEEVGTYSWLHEVWLMVHPGRAVYLLISKQKNNNKTFIKAPASFTVPLYYQHCELSLITWT